jgi:Ca2+-transporting ATPase
MTVRALVTAGGTVELTGTGYAPAGELRTGGPAQRAEAAAALTVACLCNNASVVERDGRWLVVGDPTEGALQVAATKAALDRAALAARFERVGEIPFSAERKLMSTIHRDRDGAVTLMTKGAPDVLLARCVRERVGGAERALTAERRAAIRAEVDRFAGDALRTLGVASCPVPAGAPLPARPEDERDLVWLGLVGMIDPPRPEAADAVRTAHAAGVRVVMITGDHPATAAAIAAELGIAARGDAVESGADLERMSDAALAASAARTNVYARVSPEHKLAIVRALHAGGQVVAMTGDGVNDAPALKAADIGIAMGITGTDVAKDAADIVLADDNFASIVAAIEEGRSIYSNIQKFLRYLLSANLGEVLVMFFGVVLAGLIGLGAAGGAGLVLPLLAVQILWVNLVTDSLPALAVGIDPPEPALMRRAPRDPKIGVITPRMWAGICVAAIVIAAGTLAALDAGLPGGLLPGSGPVEYARTLAFTTLVLFELYDVFCARSDEETTLHRTFRNGWLLAAVAIGLALQLAVVYTPSLQQAFGTVPLAAADWAFCAAIAASIVLWREAGKAWWRGVDRWRSAPAAAASAVR